MMRHLSITPLIICVLMLAAMVSAIALEPHQRMADQLPALRLKNTIPEQFGGWRIDATIIPVSQSADVQAKLDELYSETLARTYANAQGQRIMLSIAYGADQSGDGNQVHRPEFCYAAQGFQLRGNQVASLITQFGTLPVRRLLAVQGARNEPITYWVTVGDKATLPGIQRKLNQLIYGLSGTIPDGMLVRVSSIDADPGHAYQLQEAFIRDLLQAMPVQERARVAGRFGA